MNRSTSLFARAAAAALALLAAALCLGGGTPPDGGPEPEANPSESREAEKARIDYEDVEWSVGDTVIEGERRIGMSYSNRSPYKILSLRLEFSAMDGLTDEQLEAFASMKYPENAAEKFLDDGLYCDIGRPVEAGADSSPEELLEAGYYITDIAQYELAEPDLMTIRFVTEEGKMFEETIDCRNGSVSMSSTVVDTSQWADSEMASLVPRPENAYITRLADYIGQFSFDARDVTAEEFAAYVEACKAAGFTTDPVSTDQTYYADSSDGAYDLSLFYWPEFARMDVILNGEREAIDGGLLDEARVRVEEDLTSIFYAALDGEYEVEFEWTDEAGGQ